MKTEEIKAQLGQIYDPVRHGTLAELNAIKYVGFNDEKDSVVLIVEVKDTTSKETDILKRQLAKVVKIDLGYSGIKIQLEESKTSANVGGKDTKYLFITSTKGGVGRSTVAINLAYCLKEKGYKVGILDACVYNAAISKLLKVKDDKLAVDANNKLIPFHHDDMEIISTDYFSEEEEPLMWRGDMISQMLSNYVFQVAWSKDLDYIIVDMPASTGDALIDMANYLPSAKAIILTNEDYISSLQALKTFKALMDSKIATIGFVLNKSKNEHDVKEYLESKCLAELIASIPLSKLDNNNRFLDNEAKSAIDDIADLILIQ